MQLQAALSYWFSVFLIVINDKILPVFEQSLDFEELFCAIQQDAIYLHGDSIRTYLSPTALEVKNQEPKLT